MKKNILLIVLLLSISLLATACSNESDNKSKDLSTDENFNMDAQNETFTEKESDLGELEESAEWPEERMGSLPEPKARIISVTELEGEGSIYIVLNFDEEGGGKDYLEELINMGYKESFSSEGEDFVQYAGDKEDSSEVIFMYRLNKEDSSLIYTENSESVRKLLEAEADYEDNDDEEVFELDPESSKDWPKDLMDDIPEIKAQITEVLSRDDYVSIEFENINKKDILAYIEEIKAFGFEFNKTEATIADIISYKASNNKDHTLTVNWSDNKGYIDYAK